MCRRDLARACERNPLPGAGREEERLLIRRFTRHARNETVAAAVARVLEPRFEAVDARFAALDTKWEHRFKEMEDESRSRDAAWKERFADLRNEMVTLRESFANLRTYMEGKLTIVDHRIDMIDVRLASFSPPVVRGFARNPDPGQASGGGRGWYSEQEKNVVDHQ